MKHILVVDDEPEALTFLEIVLKRNDYRPLLARDGAEALELLEKLRVDLILADVAMPRMNGYQLCQQVKNSSRLSWVLIPFIFISSKIHAVASSPLEACGLSRHCRKLGGVRLDHRRLGRDGHAVGSRTPVARD